MAPKKGQQIDRAKLIYRKTTHPRCKDLEIFRFQLFERETYHFSPGQFCEMSINSVFETDPKKADRLAWRSYSIASPPSERDFLEFYIREKQHPDKYPVAFTPHLFKLEIGDEVNIIEPKGKFTFDNLNHTKIILLCAGTGLAPFRSWIQELYRNNLKNIKAHGDNPLELYLAHGASYSWDLGYREELEQIAQESQNSEFDFKLTYIATVSRPHIDTDWQGPKGRIENALADGQIEEAFGCECQAGKAEVYVCGFNDTVNNIRQRLLIRGFDKRDIHFEYYG